MHDVLVVGGSVAGAATAIHLARLGCSVLLIDRATFPRRKACGEGLFPIGVAELEALGVLSELQPRSAQLDSLLFEINARSVLAAIPHDRHPAMGIRREVLDVALLNAAADAGVEVCAGVSATGLLAGDSRFRGVQTEDGELEARVIVAADGLGSRLRRSAGLQRPLKASRYGVSAHYRLPDPPPARVEVRFRPGYEVYVTPVGDDVVNVALLLSRGQSTRLAGRLEQAFDSMVRPSLPDGAELVDQPLAAGPFPASALRSWSSNLVLVGDAAGFFDGITGEGMSLALQSARLAAGAVKRYLADGDTAHFKAYDRSRRALARNSTLLGRFTLLLASRPSLGGYVLGNLARKPEAFSRLIAVNQGSRGIASLRPRDLLAMLLGR